jgi:hypothetical protein
VADGLVQYLRRRGKCGPGIGGREEADTGPFGELGGWVMRSCGDVDYSGRGLGPDWSVWLGTGVGTGARPGGSPGRRVDQIIQSMRLGLRRVLR